MWLRGFLFPYVTVMQETIPTNRLARAGTLLSAGSEIAMRWLVKHVMGESTDDVAPEVLQKALGNLKGPIMKVAQMLGNIPGAVPESYRKAFAGLQTMASPMGPLFVKRRLKQELGADYARHFADFEEAAFKAASLGQIHKGRLTTGEEIVCKLQYPAMQEVIAADFKHIRMIARSIESRMKMNVTELIDEIEERFLEELDYRREARNMDVFRSIYEKSVMSSIVAAPHIPHVFHELSTDKLLVMQLCKGELLVDMQISEDQANVYGRQLFWSWYWPFYYAGTIHGDSHMGNYMFQDGQLSVFDFGCARGFSQHFVESVLMLYQGLRDDCRDQYVEAFEQWGFRPLTREIVVALHRWASYIYAPLLDDRIRPIEIDYSVQQGRKLSREVAELIAKSGGVRIPREFVFLDRATVGIAGTLLQLRSQNNWHQEFEAMVAHAQPQLISQRQKDHGVML